jgi:hypothetical protein
MGCNRIHPMKTRLCSSALGVAALACTLVAGTTSIVIEETTEARFPPTLAFTPITTGEVRLVINVDADGQLADLLVTGYTDKAFADEAVSLLKRWRYRAATVDGRPVGARKDLKMEFFSRGRVVSLSMQDSADAVSGYFSRMPVLQRVCTPRELDRPVAVVQTVSPPNPGVVLASPPSARTTLLDFYVDENGVPRMPVVVQTPDELHAKAAVWALNQWRFATPTRSGKPVTVRVRQEFIFPASDAAPADGRT